jgi:hypothetical protein
MFTNLAIDRGHHIVWFMMVYNPMNDLHEISIEWYKPQDSTERNALRPRASAPALQATCPSCFEEEPGAMEKRHQKW